MSSPTLPPRRVEAQYLLDVAAILPGRYLTGASATAGPTPTVVLLSEDTPPTYPFVTDNRPKSRRKPPSPTITSYRIHHWSDEWLVEVDIVPKSRPVHYYHAEPFGTDSWLLHGYAPAIYGPDGQFLTDFPIDGEALHLQTTPDGTRAWVGYTADHNRPAGSLADAGLLCFNRDGSHTFAFNTIIDHAPHFLPYMLHCDALNVADDRMVWVFHTDGRPPTLVLLVERHLESVWRLSAIPACRTFAIHRRRLLCGGGYAVPLHLSLVSLDD